MIIYLGTEIDYKLASHLEIGKTIILTGWNSDFYLSIGYLVTISYGALVATAVTEEICDGFVVTGIDHKLAGTWALGKIDILL